MASSPDTISHQLILDIYIMFNYTSYLGDTLQLGLIWLFEHTKISYDLYLIITQIRPGFHIYTLEMSFCLLLYNITMIRHYSRGTG